jgi:hypothetical protein
VGTAAVGSQLVRHRPAELDAVPPAPSLAVPTSGASLAAAASWTRIGSLPAEAGTVTEVAGFDGGYVAITSSGSSVWFSPDGRSWESVTLPLDVTGGAKTLSVSARTYGVAGKGTTVVVVGSYRHEPCASTPTDQGSAACPSAPISWTSTDGRHWTGDFPGPMPTAPSAHAQGGVLGPVYPTVTGGWDAVVAYRDGDGLMPTELLHAADGLAWALVLDGDGPPVVDENGFQVTLLRSMVERGRMLRTTGGTWMMPGTTNQDAPDGRAVVELSTDAIRWLDEVLLPVPANAAGSKATTIVATDAGYLAEGSYHVDGADGTSTTYRLDWTSPDGRAWSLVTPVDTLALKGLGGAIANGPAGLISLVGYHDGSGAATDVLALR